MATSDTKKMFELLNKMPDFVTDFILNFTSADKILTKLHYAYDIEIFLNYMVNYMPEHAEKDIKDITLSDLKKVSSLDINRYLTVYAGSEHSSNYHKGSTVMRRRAAISSMYSFFVKAEKLEKNPVLLSMTIKQPEKDVIYLNDDEQNLLIQTIISGNGLSGKAKTHHKNLVNRDLAMIFLILDTGLRISEILKTDMIDYDFDLCCVYVTRKGGDIQSVYFSDQCADYLKTYFDTQTNWEPDNLRSAAFLSRYGERLTVRSAERLVKKYIDCCMPSRTADITPHKLRSSFAMSFYRDSGNNLLLLQKKLNHKNITTTNIYAKASEEEMKNSRNWRK